VTDFVLIKSYCQISCAPDPIYGLTSPEVNSLVSSLSVAVTTLCYCGLVITKATVTSVCLSRSVVLGLLIHVLAKVVALLSLQSQSLLCSLCVEILSTIATATVINAAAAAGSC